MVRTGATTSYYFEIPDQQGTNVLYLDNTAQTPTWRQFTPYGAARGTTVTWIDNRGFLNKPADTATGLTYRRRPAYDPTTGQFISPDPELNASDPQDLNPYDYAEDNPETRADPTGEMPCDAEGHCGSYQYLESLPGNKGNSSSSGSSGGCPDYLPGCPGFTGGGAPSTGETLYGPGYDALVHSGGQAPASRPVIRCTGRSVDACTGVPHPQEGPGLEHVFSNLVNWGNESALQHFTQLAPTTCKTCYTRRGNIVGH